MAFPAPVPAVAAGVRPGRAGVEEIMGLWSGAGMLLGSRIATHGVVPVWRPSSRLCGASPGGVRVVAGRVRGGLRTG